MRPTGRVKDLQGMIEIRIPRRDISDREDSRTAQSHALKEYLKTPHRHETWDWEKKAKDRGDKITRM